MLLEGFKQVRRVLRSVQFRLLISCPRLNSDDNKLSVAQHRHIYFRDVMRRRASPHSRLLATALTPILSQMLLERGPSCHVYSTPSVSASARVGVYSVCATRISLDYLPSSKETAPRRHQQSKWSGTLICVQVALAQRPLLCTKGGFNELRRSTGSNVPRCASHACRVCFRS